ncbi:VOC family protein [Nocardioides sp.]|uniref:VOC family protein n=1 Tax=Nocardioides sp. TaxID=35761 RepID=UPI003783C2CE
MTAFVSHTAIDCHDAYALSEWWKPVLGYVDLDGDPNLPGHEECMIRDPETGHQLLFIEVPDTKTVKNRLHLDLRPRAATRDEEVEGLLAAGATLVADHRGVRGPGTGWVTLADPEGNEFCLLRSEAELSG